jgi:hypothetical protein
MVNLHGEPFMVTLHGEPFTVNCNRKSIYPQIMQIFTDAGDPDRRRLNNYVPARSVHRDRLQSVFFQWKMTAQTRLPI